MAQPMAVWMLLTNGGSVLIDREDHEKWGHLPWTYNKATGQVTTTLSLGRIISNASSTQQVDHIHHNELDFRKKELRACSRSENCRNRKKPKGGISQYKGVQPTWYRSKKKGNRWSASIHLEGKIGVHLGTYSSEIEAAKAYDRAAIKHFGQFALTNFKWEVTNNKTLEQWTSNHIGAIDGRDNRDARANT